MSSFIGSEFVSPVPEKSNHFNSVWVFHPASGTIHVDDTVMYASDPPFLLKLAGFKKGSMAFHPSMKGPGFHPTREAPYHFKDWVTQLLDDWDFDNICTAHLGMSALFIIIIIILKIFFKGNKIGGAKAQLRQTLAEAEPMFKKVSKRNESKRTYDESKITTHNVSGNECG